LPKRELQLLKSRGELINRQMLDNERQIGALLLQKIQVDLLRKDALSKGVHGPLLPLAATFST